LKATARSAKTARRAGRPAEAVRESAEMNAVADELRSVQHP